MKKILQVFKNWFSCISDFFWDRKKAYLCDPERAIKCKKTGCWIYNHGPCKCTIKKKYAKRDSNGKPIRATDADLCNMDYYEYLAFNTFKDEEFSESEESQKKQGL